jgi:cytochrome P450
MDPPQHGEYRSVMSRRFTPRAVLELKPKIERITRDVLDAVVDLRECDFVLDISAKIPLAVIAELLGCPREDWEQLFRGATRSSALATLSSSRAQANAKRQKEHESSYSSTLRA